MQQLTADMIRTKLENLTIPVDKEYLTVYPKLLQAVETMPKTAESLIATAHIAYGWMPTILKHAKAPADIAQFYQDLNAGSLEEKFLEAVTILCNNSIIGGSKLLHFLKPMLYPIWDTRVYRAIENKSKADHSTVNKIVNYTDYTVQVRTLADGATLVEEIRSKLTGFNCSTTALSAVRLIEMVLFYSAPEKDDEEQQ